MPSLYPIMNGKSQRVMPA